MKSMKDLRVALFALYQASKELKEPISLQKFKELFADELYAEAMAALKARENEAAQGVVQLTSIQALVLKSRGKLTDRINLRFKEATEQLLETMSGFEVIGAEMMKIHGKDCFILIRSNGIEESYVFAEMPEMEVNQILFVQEPYAMIGEEPKTWTEMTPEERIAASKGSGILTASRMTKSMLKRRIKVESMQMRTDNRTGWVDVTYLEIEPFQKSEEDRQALVDEFLPSEIGADDGEADTGSESSAALEAALEAQQEQHNGINASIDEETILGLGENDPPEDGELAVRDREQGQDSSEVPE